VERIKFWYSGQVNGDRRYTVFNSKILVKQIIYLLAGFCR